MKAYPVSLRSEIVTAYKNNEGSMLKLACRFGVSRSFVQKIIKQERNTGNLKPLKRECKTSQLFFQNTVKEVLKTKPDTTLKELCRSLNQIAGIEVSQSTMWRFIHQIK